MGGRGEGGGLSGGEMDKSAAQQNDRGGVNKHGNAASIERNGGVSRRGGQRVSL